MKRDFQLPWPGAAAVLAALFCLDPRRLFPAVVVSVAVHELGHLLALVVCGADTVGFSLSAWGAVLHTPALGWRQTVFCALAGPAAGLLLAAGLLPRWPIGGAVSGLMSVWNLLPLEPLDGGRAVSALAAGLLPADAFIWLQRGQTVLLAGLWGLAVWRSLFCHGGLVPLLLVSSLVVTRALAR